ncbi:response regulator [Haladaptatus salinisoli]|uniref:response regulator n=1 Tax=Haladaptatus salinisoli TaxID=2884876 RepID=UPI001D0B7522|nr:response regulator [Haladaptatus salinisoli]
MSDAALIFALGKQERNLELLADLLKDGGYDVEIATSITEFDRLLERRDDVTIAVLDVDGFTEDIWKRCKQLNDRDISMLVLAAQISPHMRQKAISRGAQTLLEKPIEKADLQATIRGLMEYIRMNR